MGSRWLCLLAGLTGCDQVLQLERHVPGCADATFFVGGPLPGLDSGPPKYNPALRRDELELFYVEYDPNSRTQIKVVSRASADEPFEPSLPFELGATALGQDSDPSLAQGGKRIAFLSTRDNVTLPPRPFEATRASLSEPFGQLRSIALFADSNSIHSIDISIDGLTLYVLENANDPSDLNMRNLSIATRKRVEDEFADRQLVLSAHVDEPALSPDQLELFFIREEDFNQPEIRRLTRSTTRDLFVADPTPEDPGELVSPGADPSVSATSTTLVYAVGNAIHAKRRTCD